MSMRPRAVSGTPNFIALPKVFIDLETTGERLDRGGEICEAGLVKVEPWTGQVIGELGLKFAVTNPLGKTEEELSFGRYNGFTFAEWINATPAEQALDQLNEFCAGCIPWGYNISFEYMWLSDYFTRYGQDWRGDYHWFDLMTRAVEVLHDDVMNRKLTTLSLSAIGTHLSLSAEAKPHRGLAGARYEVLVDAHLTSRRSTQ